jgi:hypothetical protein
MQLKRKSLTQGVLLGMLVLEQFMVQQVVLIGLVVLPLLGVEPLIGLLVLLVEP